MPSPSEFAGRLFGVGLIGLAGLFAVACTANETVQVNERPMASESSTERAVDRIETDSAQNAQAEDSEAETTEAEITEAETTEAESDSETTEDLGDRADAIRGVDFRNNFVYDNVDGRGTPASVVDGEYANGEFGSDDYFWFGVTDVQFGDLTGDGVEEAVVAMGLSGGGSGFFEGITAYQLVDGEPQAVASAPFGDRAFGGIAEVTIADNSVDVLAFTNGQGSCCPNEAAPTRLSLSGGELAVVEDGRSLRWFDLSQGEEQRLLKFLPGTSAAYVRIASDDSGGSLAFEAGPGQTIRLQTIAGPAATFALSDTTTGQLVDLAAATLPSDAIYELTLMLDADRDEQTTVLLEITE